MQHKVKIGLVSGIAALMVVLTITFVVADSARQKAAGAGETTLKVANLSCGSCLYTIEGELRKYDGMVGMTADLASGLITVKHTEELTPERLVQLVSGAGYPARLAGAEDLPGGPRPGGGYGGYGCGSGCGPKGCAFPVPPGQG